MKHLIASFFVLAGATGQAAEYSNPFVGQPRGPIGVIPPPPPPAPVSEPLPASYVENRTVFDLLEVVGRSASFAVLRYPMANSTSAAMSGSSTTASASAGAAASVQGISYRDLVVRNGHKTFIGGRSFKVELPAGSTNVRLVDSKSGKVLWEGDLSGPKTYYVDPVAANYQYTPPLSAGSGVGQTAGEPAVAAQGSVQSAASSQPVTGGVSQ